MATTKNTTTRKKTTTAKRAEPRAAAPPGAPAKEGGLKLPLGSAVTFTISRAPNRPAQQKTLRRLMRMQPKIQTGLKKLSIRRQRDLNWEKQRGGWMWISRVRTTKLAHVGAGESFTIVVTPQIIPDIRSVEKFLEVSKG